MNLKPSGLDVVSAPMSDTSDAPMVFASPCDADLAAMPSFDGGRRRFCAECMRSVHMLSDMGRDEAQAFIRANPGACMSYRRGPDGRLEFRAPVPKLIPPSRLRARPRFASSLRSGFAAPVVGLVGALAGCTPHQGEFEAVVDDEEQLVPFEDGEFANYSVVPDERPCDPPEPKNEILVDGQLLEFGEPGTYAGGLSSSEFHLPPPPIGEPDGARGKR